MRTMSKLKKKLMVIGLLIVGICLLILLGYMLMKQRGWDLVNYWLLYAVIAALIISTGLLVMLLVASKNWHYTTMISGCFFILIGLSYPVNQLEQSVTRIKSTSPQKKHTFLLESVDQKQFYVKKIYWKLFSKIKEPLPYVLSENYEIDWLTEDSAVFTYETTDKTIHQYIGTYGGDPSHYSYVVPDLDGNWMSKNKLTQLTYLPSITNPSTKIKIVNNQKKEQFDINETIQFGVSGVVLQNKGDTRYSIIPAQNGKSKESILILKEAKLKSKVVTLTKY